jgi:hypothetical protein
LPSKRFNRDRTHLFDNPLVIEHDALVLRCCDLPGRFQDALRQYLIKLLLQLQLNRRLTDLAKAYLYRELGKTGLAGSLRLIEKVDLLLPFTFLDTLDHLILRTLLLCLLERLLDRSTIGIHQ